MKYTIFYINKRNNLDAVDVIFHSLEEAESEAFDYFKYLSRYEGMKSDKLKMWIDCYADDDEDMENGIEQYTVRCLYTIIDENDAEGLFEFRSFDFREARNTFDSLCEQRDDEERYEDIALVGYLILTNSNDPDEAYDEFFNEYGETVEEHNGAEAYREWRRC